MRRGLTLFELLTSMSIFYLIAAVTFLLYNDARASINRSMARLDSHQLSRLALQRSGLLLQSAYIPPINNVTSPFEMGNSLFGNGTQSVTFYAPGDLIQDNATLYPVVAETGPYNPSAGPKLYQINLDATYQLDPGAAYQPDQPAVPGPPPLLMRTLVMREMYIPDHSQPYSTIQYLVSPGSSPQPSTTPNASTPTRILGQRLSDAHFALAPGGRGLTVTMAAQGREGTLNSGQLPTIQTFALSTDAYFWGGR